jgi:hypothetical protein
MVYGRSCDSCTLNFMTSNPEDHTCPWCQKAGEHSDSYSAYSSRGGLAPERPGLDREER